LALENAALVESVLASWETAPVSPQLRATLGFVRKQALEDDLSADDVDAMRSAGVSEEAIRDAIVICGAFSILTRIADSFGCTPASELLAPAEHDAYTAQFLHAGYR
jgi:alkylhydroperoxidase family enzyme